MILNKERLYGSHDHVLSITVPMHGLMEKDLEDIRKSVIDQRQQIPASFITVFTGSTVQRTS